MKVHTKLFNNAIKNAVIAINKTKISNMLVDKIHLKVEYDYLLVEATDGFRFHQSKVPIEDIPIENFDCLLTEVEPVKTKENFIQNNNSYEICDHYSSFYLRIKDELKFMESIKLDRLVEYEIITKKERADYKRYLRYYYNANFYSNTYEKYKDILMELAPILLRKIEKLLHDYEAPIPEADCFCYFMENLDLYSYMFIDTEKDNETLYYRELHCMA